MCIRDSRNTALAALFCFAATGALAAGNHASGHGGDANDAVGKPGVAAKNTRTINVEMTDGMRFSPADISVKQGETVRFVVKNAGQLKHELVLGTPQDLKAHYETVSYTHLDVYKRQLQPKLEANFYSKNDPQRGIGSGLSDMELGVRLRYEVTRQFAPCLLYT